MADRARAFEVRLAGSWQIQTAYRTDGRFASIPAFARWLGDTRPDLVYVFDMALAGVVAAGLHRWRSGARLVVDTGDAITALARSLRGPVGVAVTAALERFALASADHIVVRGTYHRELLAAKGVAATVIPDGVDLDVFQPRDDRRGRTLLGVGDELTIGVLGSCIWSPSVQIAYGWDLVELLGLLRGRPVKGVLIGDGSGVAHLRERARALGVEDQMVFAGRRPMEELPDLLAACDICLSTQTNDDAGNVRTTGKLPLYLACGRYVLASRVGEARYVLPEEMLVPYDGLVDRAYPGRLAERVRVLADDRAQLTLRDRGPAIAHEHFDYNRLAARLATLLTTLDGGHADVPDGMRA